MEENIKQNATSPPEATAGGSYGHGWGTLKKYFLELLLITFIIVLIDAPFGWFNKSSLTIIIMILPTAFNPCSTGCLLRPRSNTV